jgi:hypothetical protein
VNLFSKWSFFKMKISAHTLLCSLVACAGVLLHQAAMGQTPSAPTQLTANAVSDAQVNLNWSASTGSASVAGYYVYRNGVQVGTPTGTDWGTATGTATAYSDVDLTPSTVYTYTVVAYTAGGAVSAPSPAATTTTWPAIAIPPAPHIPPFYTCVTNYYVSATGSNSGTGSSANPWNTISAAMNYLSGQGGTLGGVCVNVGPGTYTEAVNGNALSGSSDSPTGYFVLRSTTSHGAIIQLPSNSPDYTTAISFLNASYIVIDGFVLSGSDAAPNIDGSGINATGSSPTQCTAHHIRIYNNIAYGWGGSGIATQRQDYYDEEGNVAYNTSNTSIWGVSAINTWEPVALDSGTWSSSTMDSASVQYHTIIRYNVSYNNAEVNIGANPHYDGNGITLDTYNAVTGYVGYTQQTLVDSNLSFDNGGGGIVTGGSGASFVTVRNNTAFSNYIDAQNPSTGHGDIAIGGSVSSHNNIIVNNIGVENSAASTLNYALEDIAYSYAQSNTDETWMNNLAFDGIAEQASTYTTNTSATFTTANGNLLGVDPQFVNYLSGDFSLRATSPAVGAGTTAYGVAAQDLAGNPRTSSGKVDIGAYEYSSGTAPAAPTSALILNLPATITAGSAINVQTFLLSNGVGTPTGNLSLSATQSGGSPQQLATASAATALITAYATGGAGAPASVTFAQAGAYTLSASYAGDANFAAATSPNYNVEVAAAVQPTANFSVSVSPSSLTVASGQSGTVQVSITPQNGFNAVVSFYCSGLPVNASCSFSPTTVTPAGATATTTLTVSASSAVSALRRNSRPLFPSAMLAAALCCLGLRKRRLMRTMLLLAVGILGLSLLNGCGGSSGSSTTVTPVTATVTVNATAGALMNIATFSLTVN